MDGHADFAARLDARLASLPGATRRDAVPAGDIPALLAEHDVLVLPSLWPENSPLIVREAAAAGLPVILSAQGGARELAPDARRVAAGDVAALTAALLAEVAEGRRRLEPARWPTPAEHAARLTAEAYRGGDANPRGSG